MREKSPMHPPACLPADSSHRSLPDPSEYRGGNSAGYRPSCSDPGFRCLCPPACPKSPHSLPHCSVAPAPLALLVKRSWLLSPPSARPRHMTTPRVPDCFSRSFFFLSLPFWTGREGKRMQCTEKERDGGPRPCHLPGNPAPGPDYLRAPK